MSCIFHNRNHTFDIPDRTVSNPRRKSGVISNIHEPARGSKGIREDHYKVDESKILPHIRAGIQLDDSIYVTRKTQKTVYQRINLLPITVESCYHSLCFFNCL